MRYYNYKIETQSKFNASDYPEITSELKFIKKGVESLPETNKVDIMISYWKNHSIKIHLIDTNPKLAQAVTSDSFPSSSIQSLFESGSSNKYFIKKFEDYIESQV
jgi:hypothetical protein